MARNCTARLILGRRKYDHATPMLVELHWLPVKELIANKIMSARLQMPQPFSSSVSAGPHYPIQEEMLTGFREQEL